MLLTADLLHEEEEIEETRSGKRIPRQDYDEYPTPPALCEAGVSLIEGTPRLILDPGAGHGHWGGAARRRWPTAHISGIEIQGKFKRPVSYDSWITADFGDWCQEGEARPGFDLCIGNPPFCLASEFVEWGLSQLRFGGQLLYLMRLAFSESKGRARGLFDRCPPALIVQCDKVQFYGDCTSREPYAFFLFVKDWKGPTTFDWLERRRWRERMRTQPVLLEEN
jgi:hypothetical protein